MSGPPLDRLARTAGLTLLTAVVVLCCAGRADAACGDYVKVLGPVGAAHSPDGPPHAPAKAPCHGPNCTGGPRAPAPVPPASAGAPAAVKALVPDARPDPEQPFAGPFVVPAGDAPVRHPSAIFHPPRPA